MKLNQVLNLAGLLFDLLGALTMFLVTEPINYSTYIYHRAEEIELNDKARKKNTLMKAGMLSIALGSIFQMMGNIILN